ncbi:MAG: ABC transporter permease [SAR324 cluster bacterium]|jgi:NitT/TauT family transport system permease protein|nr:ABC transporter permease [Deltaproteobacteria bacterium]MAE00341.1 ABC transporter permease [Pseudomonadota bacterium]MDP6092670.1 ABC transporter permease [SAR324 cluster bacterium]MBI14529.1 ABC transporter permease [Deltaproteobacteria bacterium]MBP45775.1 ABC transporter permease [Deltaproteobacteria bacterium]|tara:strand:- start:858 stop:1742 length:885 start_codon:yes stop_codon:yes gene_type:complete
MLKRLRDSSLIPVTVVVGMIILIWYAGAVYLNAPMLIDQYERQKTEWNFEKLRQDAWAMKRPILPAPHQILADMNQSIIGRKVTSKRSLIYHGWITISSTLVGFGIGASLGILLAVGIVYIPTLNRSVMPWIIASQTIPILAIAPMIIVVLGSIGLTGLIPKAIISAYLCFFPVTIGMVKGLRSPDPILMDLMRTYNSNNSQTFFKLRWPASTTFLFTSFKVSIAISLVGAIVGELPAGARAGLGSRLLVGSYYGQTIQIWSALITASLVAGLLVYLMTLLERLTISKMGGRLI